MYLSVAVNAPLFPGHQSSQRRRFCFPYWGHCGREDREDEGRHSAAAAGSSLLAARPITMCLLRIVRRACSAEPSPGKVFLVCLLLDAFYLACVYESAVLPTRRNADNFSEGANTSSPTWLRKVPGASLKSSTSSSTSASSSSSSAAASSSAASSTSSSPSSHPSAFSFSSPNASSSSSSRSPSSKSSLLLDILAAKRFSDADRHNSGNGSSSSSSGNYLLPQSLDVDSANFSVHHTDINVSTNNRSEADNSGKPDSGSTAGGDQISSPHAGTGEKVPKEFPMALVVASSTAAVSILLFFCLSYVWHTRQLDRRAQKLAIRLAAEVESELNNCSQCRSVRQDTTTVTTRENHVSYVHGSCQDSASDSGGEESPGIRPTPPPLLDELNSLREEDEDDQVFADGSRQKPGGVGRTLGNHRGSRGRGRRSGSRSSRKWSAHSGGHPNRSSLVTDKEILNHFASRRHSTFFI